MALSKKTKYILIAIALVALAILYKNYHPGHYSFFPDCPFLSITGLYCPGCGSQRATHYLLNADLLRAFKLNPLMVLAIPYMALGAFFDFYKSTHPFYLKCRKTLFGPRAIYIVLSIVILFWILRNTLDGLKI